MKFITKGSKIGISSPASLPNQDELKMGIEILKNAGFEVEVGESCYRTTTEVDKVSELYYLSDICDLTVCSRGGGGSYRLIDYMKKPLNKPICGYSDITSLLALQYKFGASAFHSPMVVEFWKDRESFDFFIELLTGKISLPLEFPKKMNALTLKQGRVVGKLFIGNLSLIVTVMNQIGLDVFNDSILIVEDVNESFDSIDRMLWKLTHELKDRIKSLIFAGFTSTRKGSNDYNIIDILKYHIGYLDVPSFIGFPTYHGKFLKYTLPIGAKVEVDSEKCSVKLIDYLPVR